MDELENEVHQIRQLHDAKDATPPASRSGVWSSLPASLMSVLCRTLAQPENSDLFGSWLKLPHEEASASGLDLSVLLRHRRVLDPALLQCLQPSHTRTDQTILDTYTRTAKTVEKIAIPKGDTIYNFSSITPAIRGISCTLKCLQLYHLSHANVSVTQMNIWITDPGSFSRLRYLTLGKYVGNATLGPKVLKRFIKHVAPSLRHLSLDNLAAFTFEDDCPNMPDLTSLELSISSQACFDVFYTQIRPTIQFERLLSFSLSLTTSCLVKGNRFIFQLIGTMQRLEKLALEFVFNASSIKWPIIEKFLLEQGDKEFANLKQLKNLKFAASNKDARARQTLGPWIILFGRSFPSIQKLTLHLSGGIHLSNTYLQDLTLFRKLKTLLLDYSKSLSSAGRGSPLASVKTLTLRNLDTLNSTILSKVASCFPNLFELNISVKDPAAYSASGTFDKDMCKLIRKTRSLRILGFLDDHPKVCKRLVRCLQNEASNKKKLLLRLPWAVIAPDQLPGNILKHETLELR